MSWYATVFVDVVLLFVVTADATTPPAYTYTSNPLTLTTVAHSTSRTDKNSTAANFSSNAVSTSQPWSHDATTNIDSLVSYDVMCSGRCDNLSAECYTCNTSDNCTYGDTVYFPCRVNYGVTCTGSRDVRRAFKCIYCFLLQQNVDFTCEQSNTSCHVGATPPQRTKMNCTVNQYVFCLGKRNFSKMTRCNWTSGYKWSTALILSITLGGFGADRFYLGFWREGLGKLFSFGGLGVWTLIDIVLIATSYLSPADGSLYIY